MPNEDKHYPNVNWPQFAVCNDDATGAFENMARRLFSLEFLENGKVPHSNHNNPGVEVLPILEAPHIDGSKQRKISFQAKYFEGKIDYSKIQESAYNAVKYYGSELDLIYLFCNKTLTTTTGGYKKTEAILKKANIELYPISNLDILSLVVKHKEIANYFFLPRLRPGDAFLSQMYNTEIVLHAKENAIESIAYSEQPKEQNIDSRLLHSFVQEKIELCRSFILGMKLSELRKELDRIFTYRISGIEGAEKLLFYKLIVDLHDGNEVETDIEELTDDLKKELQWLIKYYENPVPIGAYVFASHCIEVQAIVLDKMFAAQLWDAVITLCKVIVDDTNSEIGDIVRQYYGLALFNLQKYVQAVDILKGLYQKTRKETDLLYSILAEIKCINCAWREGHYELKDRLLELVEQLNSLKENKQYKSNINLIAMLYLETAYNLGVSEKEYLETAVEKYNSFSEEVKNNYAVKYLYALCLEVNGNIDLAEKIYSELDWEKNAEISCRYMICKLSKRDYNGAVSVYKKLCSSVQNTKLKGLYLTALFYTENVDYEKTLKSFVDETRGNFAGIIDIALGLRDKKSIQTYILPEVKRKFNDELENLELTQKNELLSILSLGGEVTLILEIIKNISDVKKLNRYIIKEIYDSTFAICNKEFIAHNKGLIKSQELDASEQIADRFLEANVLRREFLQIKYLCAGAKEKRFSLLKYAKELFEITNEDGLARNIISMLSERNETDYNAYAPYFKVLSSSTKPDYCMAVASAMLRLGKTEEADLYAYKALYYLNDTEDYEIYKSYLGYYNQNLNRYHDKREIQRVRGNSVVILEESTPVDAKNPVIMTLCLDSESEFSDINNRSMEVEHVPSNHPLFLKLQGSGLKQILKIDGINYRIKEIHSRTDFAASFIFKKINQYPEKFNGAVWIFSAGKPEEFIEKIKSLTDRTKQTEALLNFYHFKENEIGLPIDAFTEGDYDRYIDALTMLLYTKNQAFYTGYPTYENEENQKYVPSLSTIVLLSSMNLLNVLDAVKDSLLFPASYMDFFAKRYSKAKEVYLLSPGKLVNVDNQLALIKNDLSHVEIWERIIDFCTGCKSVEISDEERIEFTIGDGINGEEFIAAANLHLIHLDAFILAAKEQTTLLCDDLFFRKMATYSKIRNINFVSLLWHYVDKDFVVPIILELSKTNYLYIPLLARTDEEAIKLKKNILDGELKKKYYGNMLIAYNVAWKKVMRELFGEDIEFEDLE